MEKRTPFAFRRGDFFAVILVLLLAAAVFLAFFPEKNPNTASMVQIYQNGVLLNELPLSRDVQLEISGQYTNILVIRDGSAAISHSDCPGGDCMHSGSISAPGRSIACLPNRVEVRISGSSDVDFVVG